MRVQEVIEALSKMDPKAPVTIWQDGELYDMQDVSVINAEQARRERRHKNTVTVC
jgi:hypothetical protein